MYGWAAHAAHAAYAARTRSCPCGLDTESVVGTSNSGRAAPAWGTWASQPAQVATGQCRLCYYVLRVYGLC
jgi:hypothetical protein